MNRRNLQAVVSAAFCLLAIVTLSALAADAPKHARSASSKPSASAPASMPASQPAVTAWTGTVEKTKSGVPRLVVDKMHYRLKAADKADASVKTTLEQIDKGELTGKYDVTGTAGEAKGTRVTLLVDSIHKAL